MRRVICVHLEASNASVCGLECARPLAEVSGLHWMDAREARESP